ncbi:class I glutamine amidotransferase-like protein [Fusarium austroafricanum]|uniref:Class I glutamine amidotransferase-like protein n=1 Tax=Fusarium austroafricanum TaxID=2364996 RepID=A0A8H4KCL5_9HYPO|nr:class I glutamine amidotransferase-like protein [Fusarium austroafricanum]
MASSPLTLRIAMLNADTPVPAVLSKCGPSYGHIFHDLLIESASRVAPGLTVEAEFFDVHHRVYPESVTSFDAIIISGSSASSYEYKEWIKGLDAYIAKVYVEHPEVKLFGSCFGHQIICQSLLRERGIYVEHDPNGYEMGVHTIQLESDFLKALGGRLTPMSEDPPQVEDDSKLRLQFIHGDHVKIPEDKSLPPNWLSMGRTEHCAFQGAYEPNRVLTYQGHFEFDRFINTETCKAFGKSWGWDSEFIDASTKAMDKDDDAKPAADMVMRFFLEGRDSMLGAGGLMTPPVEN